MGMSFTMAVATTTGTGPPAPPPLPLPLPPPPPSADEVAELHAASKTRELKRRAARLQRASFQTEDRSVITFTWFSSVYFHPARIAIGTMAGGKIPHNVGVLADRQVTARPPGPEHLPAHHYIT